MNRRRVAPALTVAALLVASSASAQSPSQSGTSEPNRVGITMGYPCLDRRDLGNQRPSCAAARGVVQRRHQRSVGAGRVGTSSDTWTVAIGVSALYYVGKWDALRTYIAPRFSYSRGTTSVDSSFGGENDLKSEGIAINGLFGAEYSLHRRFSVFGEVGAGFSSGETNSSTPIEARTESSSFGTRTGVGVIFYF